MAICAPLSIRSSENWTSSMRILSTALVTIAVVLAAAGCSKEIVGTPVATPGEAGMGLDTTELLATSCREYLEMDDSGRREVMKAIADNGNQLVGMNPEIWVSVAAGLCEFVDPSAPVKDIVVGQGIR